MIPNDSLTPILSTASGWDDPSLTLPATEKGTGLVEIVGVPCTLLDVPHQPVGSGSFYRQVTSTALMSVVSTHLIGWTVLLLAEGCWIFDF